MNTYQRMKNHLTIHMYKRGMYKGDAPADGSRRAKRHFRIIDRGNHMAVRMYNTDILQAYPDGRLVLDTSGYIAHSTTKANLNEALYRFARITYSGSITPPHTRSVFSYSQMVMGVGGKLIRYYDGITLHEAEGKFTITSELRAFQATRINKEESKELHDGLKTSGFKGMFKILHAASPKPEGSYVGFHSRKMKEIICDADHADRWAEVISSYSWYSRYALGPNGLAPKWFKKDAKDVWADIMKRCKESMYETVTTEVYEK